MDLGTVVAGDHDQGVLGQAAGLDLVQHPADVEVGLVDEIAVRARLRRTPEPLLHVVRLVRGVVGQIEEEWPIVALPDELDRPVGTAARQMDLLLLVHHVDDLPAVIQRERLVLVESRCPEERVEAVLFGMQFRPCGGIAEVPFAEHSRAVSRFAQYVAQGVLVLGHPVAGLWTGNPGQADPLRVAAGAQGRAGRRAHRGRGVHLGEGHARPAGTVDPRSLDLTRAVRTPVSITHVI
nr:hypothetical protein [Nonomuraea cypriaca]